MRVELQGFTAFIVCNGAEVACHRIEKSEDGKTVVCWIASEVGKKFSVKWTKPHDLPDVVEAHVQVDDLDCDAVLIQKDDLPNYVYFNEGLGDIVLSIHRVETTCIREWVSETPPQERPIHERSKKATLHRVQLAAETLATTGLSTEEYVTKRLDNGPMATFIFKYRPFDVLRANGIVPTPVGTKRKSSDEPKLEVSKDEIGGPDAEKIAEIKVLEDKLLTLRSELSESRRKKPKRLKAEPLIPEGFVSGEVIDLT
ncbi:hypothetical protein FIBSPDRAFT_895030 [Athelia psychrophila]|uniref:DUF7918 domain-containing protein n=1 Tax=Athelia psychrophila TaxID=1759441 RepID=A0A166F544_9AGAM|nr:hypothetical protein FIBSPDRAFT_895030 [Fibularhizoctonia sp. CBS 109695]